MDVFELVVQWSLSSANQKLITSITYDLIYLVVASVIVIVAGIQCGAWFCIYFA